MRAGMPGYVPIGIVGAFALQPVVVVALQVAVLITEIDDTPDA